MDLKKKKIGELNGTPIVIGKKNYASKNEYYMTLNGDNTYQKIEKRVNGDSFETIIGDDIYLGSFSKEDLPVLSEEDYGKLASIDGVDSIYWNGSKWVYLNGEPVITHYLTFTANEDGSVVGFIVFNDGYDIPETYKEPSLQYSTDGGETWQDYDLQITDDPSGATPIDLDEGESVMFKGVNDNLAYYIEADLIWINVQAYCEGSVAASGDITSLLNGEGGDIAIPQYCCFYMFDSCTSLTSTPALPSTTLADYCYCLMFGGCTGLTTAPALPAITLAESCYDNMFYGCESLTQTPELSATMLAVNCYRSMFQNCTSLITAPALPATTLAQNCYAYMFSGCTSLIQAPTLPATTLADACYEFMFSGCTAITSHDMATLNTSMYVFDQNSSCASFTIHSVTAPAIDSTTITGLKADCIIYVPDLSVNSYKRAANWVARANYIQAITKSSPKPSGRL